jgi:hypothetical protein
LREGVVKPAMGVMITQGAQLAVVKIVDGIFRGRIDPKKKELSEKYKDVDKINVDGEVQDRQDHQRNQEKNPALQVNDDLKLAIELLKRAKETTLCRVCRPRIEDAKEYVEDKTKEIIRAGEIDKKMKELQSTGELAKKPWRELTEEEKDFVRGKVDSRKTY